MTNNFKQKKAAPAAKQSYPEFIRTRAKETYEKASDVDNSESAVEIIYDALKLTALESWKNGLSAGQRRSKPGSAGAA